MNKKIRLGCILVIAFVMVVLCGCSKDCKAGCGRKASPDCSADMCDSCCAYYQGFNGCRHTEFSTSYQEEKKSRIEYEKEYMAKKAEREASEESQGTGELHETEGSDDGMNGDICYAKVCADRSLEEDELAQLMEYVETKLQENEIIYYDIAEGGNGIFISEYFGDPQGYEYWRACIDDVFQEEAIELGGQESVLHTEDYFE